jgi:hypothetical protein
MTIPAGKPEGHDRSLVIALASGVAIGAFFVCLARAGSASGLWPLVIARAVSTVALAATARLAKVPRRSPRGGACSRRLWSARRIGERALSHRGTRGAARPGGPVQSIGLACAAAAIVMITSR